MLERSRKRPGLRFRVGTAMTSILVVFLFGCQSTTRVGDRFYEDGRYAEASAAFQSFLESEPSDRELVARTLYRLGVALGYPGTSVYDPKASVETLELLLESFPDSPFAAEAMLIRDLQLKLVELESDIERDRLRLAEMEMALAQKEAELMKFASDMGEKDDQIEALRESIPPLRVEIRNLIHRLAEKERELEQLERLKAIDLNQPPS